jgi:putative tryptophan/tyrosine transport system substrate-binding protein
MRRREFINLIGGVAATWPLAVQAQQPPMPVVGILDNALSVAQYLASLKQGLKEGGYIEGQNVAIEYRSAEGQYGQLPALAADLVRRQVTVIISLSLAAARAAQAATTTIPIVFTSATDPVKDRLVASLSRPGGNLTGVSLLTGELIQKRLELLRDVMPNATMIAVLVNPNNPNAEENLRLAQEAARVIGQRILIVKAGAAIDFDAAFVTIVQQRAEALVIAGDPFFNSQIEQLAALTVRHAVPAIYQQREFAVAGGLMSYGISIADAYRLAGIYVGQILKGSNPAELPVQQPTKFELFINLKTAKALGLTVPRVMQMTADEVIE